MAANYPDGIDTAGPTIDKLYRHPIQYEVDVYRNEDGGADVNVQPCGILRWDLEYDGISAAEVATLRAHFNDARSRVETFSFYDRQTETLHTNVKYEAFRIGRHRKTWSNVVSASLVKFV